MIELLKATEAAIAAPEPKSLRFSRHYVPAGRHMHVGQVLTSSIEIAEFFRACWNHRHEIADMIRRSLDDGK